MDVAEGVYIVGIRPESFQASGKGTDPFFTTTVELLEWMGADLFVHFEVDVGTEGLVEASEGLASLLRELGLEDPGGGRRQLVARLDPGSRAAEGGPLDLRVRPGQVMLFDPGTGHRIEPDAEGSA